MDEKRQFWTTPVQKLTKSIRGLAAWLRSVAAREDEDYEVMHRRALELMDKGLPLGGAPVMDREELHKR